MSQNVFARAHDGAGRHWAALKDRRPAVRHLAEAWRLAQRNNGNQYAAAITYFSFLALFPLLLLAVAVAGFVLHAHPAAEQSLFDHLSANLPGSFGSTVQKSLRSAIKARTGVGLVGLFGVLLTGLGWIGNLRAAVNAVWGRPQPQRNFFVAKALNLLVLLGLGVGVLVSLGLTVGGTALGDRVLRSVSLQHVPGLHFAVGAVGIVLAILGDMIIFSWLLVRLPGVEVRRSVALKGVLFAAVAFEVLKVVGTYTIARTADSPTAGPFAGLLAVLIWIQLVARVMLFCAAWMAVLTGSETPAGVVADGRPAAVTVSAPPAAAPVASPRAVFGAGAVLGAVVGWVLAQRERRGRAAAARSRREQG